MDKEQTFWSTATPSTVPMDRAGLAALRLRQLMERAEHIGAVPAEVEKVVDEADDPKAALIDLILLTSLERQEELAKLRDGLDKLKLGQLKKLAKDKYKVDEAKVKVALEGDGVKGDLIAQIEREKKLDDWRGKQEDGKEEKKAALIKLIVQKEIETREKQWTDLRNKLEPLKLKELKEKLLELGTDMGKVEQIIDAAEGNPRRALVSLIVIATREEKTATDALRGELKRLRLGELRRRAEEAGVEDEAVNAAIDEATDPKGAVLELIMAAEPRVAQAKAAAAAMAVDGALGVTEKEAAAAERAAAEAAARKQFNYYSGVRSHSPSPSCCCSGSACLTPSRLVCVCAGGGCDCAWLPGRELQRAMQRSLHASRRGQGAAGRAGRAGHGRAEAAGGGGAGGGDVQALRGGGGQGDHHGNDRAIQVRCATANHLVVKQHMSSRSRSAVCACVVQAGGRGS